MFQERLFIPFPKNQQMFQEIDYLFLFSEKPANISRDKLFIPFPKNQLIFQERLAVLFQNRS